MTLNLKDKYKFLLLTVLLIVLVSLSTYINDKLSKNNSTSPSPSTFTSSNLVGAPETHTCKDGTTFTCNGGTLGCIDNSDMYCKKQPLLGAPETHTCRDGTTFTCNGGTLGCVDNSDMYCGVNAQWDKCVEDNKCETDPATVNPHWYRQEEMRDSRDIKRVRANNGMTIVDKCSIKNTNMIANPRCHITQGKFKGKIGQCFYDGKNVLPCAPAGGACKGQTPSSSGMSMGRCVQRNDQVMFEPVRDLNHYDLCRSPY